MEPLLTANFMPPHHGDTDRERLTADLADIIDQMMLTFQIEFRDVFDKYRSFFSIQNSGYDSWLNDTLVEKLQDTDKVVYLSRNAVSADALAQVISEFGYEYIYELLVNYRYNDENKYEYMSQAKSMLGVIHLLKGHKVGLLLIMGLLGIEAHTHEWWELVDEAAAVLRASNPTMTWEAARAACSATAVPDTYQLVITANVPTTELILALKDFSRMYVYPIVEIIVEQLVVFDDPIVWTGAMGCCIARFTTSEKRVGEEVFVNVGMMGCCISSASTA